jgi:PAS domain-containing protein
VTNYDFVIDLDLKKDYYTILTYEGGVDYDIPKEGRHSEWMAYMLRSAIVPRDREQYASGLDPNNMRRRLEKEGHYTFSYSIVDKKGDIRTKNMTVSAIDLRLGRVCLVRTDITESMREQQGMLNIMAYTFELMGFINVRSNSLTMYTRQTVLENLSPYVLADYDSAVERFSGYYDPDGDKREVREQFRLDTMLRRLGDKPNGYDFVFPYRAEDGEGLRYKQINVLWGDGDQRTVCMVRADVTEMLTAERQAKSALEKALAAARKAHHAKSDILSPMSHDIRTPMNAIMGLTRRFSSTSG